MTTTESIRHDFLTGRLGRREIILDCTATIATSGGYDAVTVSYTHLTLPTTPYV